MTRNIKTKKGAGLNRSIGPKIFVKAASLLTDTNEAFGRSEVTVPYGVELNMVRRRDKSVSPCIWFLRHARGAFSVFVSFVEVAKQDVVRSGPSRVSHCTLVICMISFLIPNSKMIPRLII